MGRGSGRRRRSGFWRLLWSKLGEGDKSLLDSPEEERKRREEAIMGELARQLSGSGFEAAGIFVAEASRPLGRLASTALRVAEPSLGLVLGGRRLSNLACLLEDRANLEGFIDRLEGDERRGQAPTRDEG